MGSSRRTAFSSSAADAVTTVKVEPGLARKVRNILIREGLTVLEFSTSPYGRIDKSLIVCRKGNYSMARRVAELTGIERICFITDTTQVSNLLIIVGEDLVR